VHLRLVNRQAALATARLQAMLDFLGPRLGAVGRPVLVTALNRAWGRSLGRAYWPIEPGARHRETRAGRYDVRLFVPADHPWSFPLTRNYQAEAGPAELQDLEELYLHVLAHELRHVEQFDACLDQWPAGRPLDGPEPGAPSHLPFGRSFRSFELTAYPGGSCEVDAERSAHAHLEAWRARPDA
jgi:hypothetical protein